MAPSEGFAPITQHDAKLLILGSLPGQRSIDAGEYYAHPRNAFWPIMESLYGASGHYEERCDRLRQRGVAVWDVLSCSERRGSLDANIRMDSAVPNDFDLFFAAHTEIRLLAFNGRKAENLFLRLVGLPEGMRACCLPSTSPAYASLTPSDKLAAWRQKLE